jgi:hypothetical protein
MYLHKGAQLGFQILSEVQKWTPELCSCFNSKPTNRKMQKSKQFSVTFGCAFSFENSEKILR